MPCQKCNSERVAKINGKTSDCCFVSILDYTSCDYVPDDMGIGGGDYLEFDLCLDCGQLQGKFPLPLTELESTEEEEDD